MSNQQYKMELTVKRVAHYDPDTMFGIYYCKPLYYNREILNKYNNVSIQGNSRKLAKDETYEIEFEGAYNHSKYGEFYKIVHVEAETLKTVADQDKFLRAILADNHFSSLKQAYPNDLLVDFILEDKIDTSKTKGIKQKTLAKIKLEVQRNAELSVLIAKLDELQLSTRSIDKILRHFGAAEKAINAINKNLYCLCDISTFGFITIDQVAIKQSIDPENPKRIYAAIDYIMKQDGIEGHTWSSKEDVIDKAIDLLNIHGNLIINKLDDLKSNPKYYITDEKVAFSHTRKKEIDILYHLKRIQDNYHPPLGIDILSRISEIEEEQGFSFTEEQKKILTESLDCGVSIINGVAGSGKSFVVKSLMDSIYEDNYIAACLSGKAVQVLSQRQIESSTIHRLLKWSPKESRFMYDENLPLPYSTVILDEASMVNLDLFLSVVEAIPNGGRFVIVGDSGQLCSIGQGAGDVLRDLLQTNTFPSFELTQVHRQAQKSGILSVASTVRQGTQLMPYNSQGQETYGELQDQTIISYSNKDSIPHDVIRIAQAYKDKVEHPRDLVDFQVIATNRERGSLSVRSLNTELQKVFNDINKPHISRNSYNYRAGDKIITNGNLYGVDVYSDLNAYETSDSNSYEADVFNGTMGYIEEIDIENKIVFIKFEDIDGLVVYEQSSLDKIDLAYAATVHRLQGSGIKNCVFCLDFSSYTLLTRELLYTGLTRTIQKGVLLVENNAMYTAIKNTASNRRTFLGELIKSNKN